MPEFPTRADSLSHAIAEAILSGEFAPGTHLDEQVLAKRFGVSRTPVRDALRLLNGTGLIDLRPRFGATVRTITPDELDMMFIAMGEIEATCARLSTLSMSTAERGQLRLLHERMGMLAEAGDHDGYVVGNQEFHERLYEGAHNSVVDEIARNLRRRLTPYRRFQFQAPGRLARSHAEHGLVVRAILARDAAAANSAMLVHMSIVEDAFELAHAGSLAAREAAGGGFRDQGKKAPPALTTKARPSR
ncbi:GntR family transcriptional regulator [Methylobacterium brachythecii]|uniref:GntR family transcriptional regulator n=1 Tax=Methylobacterium brachythecii TaxID=1176177 RepID=A0A7W6AN10_9HYPH|nr:GntR family transcriptional regulator [Methylobacterium brachythecii]MBB3904050.1 DNA-binding GntR family transcriptional regulator [Methylobacterium brachythecii]GLS42790.1 GntR family transcriptional regulator [Methylobacterium brachythecii]